MAKFEVIDGIAIIPDYVEHIPDDAFLLSDDLEQVVIPDTV